MFSNELKSIDAVVVSWDDFKQKVSEHIREFKGPRLCRGQADSKWRLTTSFHRYQTNFELKNYFQIVDKLADIVGTLENREIDTRNNLVLGSFLAYLQHHGFPTPLLDWSLSPYVAAYFAFSDVKSNPSPDEYVSIFVFDHLRWNTDWTPNYDIQATNGHVSIFNPNSSGNRRQIVQQGSFYTWTNIVDIENHVIRHMKKQNEPYMWKFNIPASEKYFVMSELEAMGITAYSLFGSIDSLCRHYKDSFFNLTIEGSNILQSRFDQLAAMNSDYYSQTPEIKTSEILDQLIPKE